MITNFNYVSCSVQNSIKTSHFNFILSSDSMQKYFSFAFTMVLDLDELNLQR